MLSTLIQLDADLHFLGFFMFRISIQFLCQLICTRKIKLDVERCLFSLFEMILFISAFPLRWSGRYCVKDIRYDHQICSEVKPHEVIELRNVDVTNGLWALEKWSKREIKKMA